MSADADLTTIRKKIDKIDEQIHALVNQRASLAVEIGKIKRSLNKEETFYRPEREAQILQKMIAANPGPLSAEQIALIFRDILTACLNLQQPLTVATLGPEGTYSQAAVIKHFGVDTQLQFSSSIEEIFKSVVAKKADFGVIPIENSTTGIIRENLDFLRNTSLKICGEINFPIHHHLWVAHKAPKKIHVVYGHQQALLQCQQWLLKNLPQAKQVEVRSNGLAAKQAEKEKGAAAIAGEWIGDHYHLTARYSNIEDNPQNQTRFLILGQQTVGASGKDKTSLLISSPHVPGTLIELLKPFAEYKINISLIESRPARDCNGAYQFFIDIEGHQEDTKVKQALARLRKESILLDILGSYPQAM